jgi:hypothetical protein
LVRLSANGGDRLSANGGPSYADWERAFEGIRACGSTSIGAGIARMLREGQRCEQLIIVSDGHENAAPYLRDALPEYEARYGRVSVTWIEIGKSDGASLARDLEALRRPYLRFRFDGDYYSLPNLVPLLSPGGRAALVDEILATPLPTRAALETLPPGFDPDTCEIL